MSKFFKNINSKDYLHPSKLIISSIENKYNAGKIFISATRTIQEKEGNEVTSKKCLQI
jgi:hypothetical protein